MEESLYQALGGRTQESPSLSLCKERSAGKSCSLALRKESRGPLTTPFVQASTLMDFFQKKNGEGSACGKAKSFLPTVFLPKVEESPLYCSWNAWLKVLPTHSVTTVQGPPHSFYAESCPSRIIPSLSPEKLEESAPHCACGS